MDEHQMTKDEALKLALKTLDSVWYSRSHDLDGIAETVIAIHSALEETPCVSPEPEPVAWKDRTYGNLHHQDFGNSIPLYTSPPKREWQGLTDEEIDRGLLRSDYALQSAHAWRAGVVFAMTQLKEKNT